jgi:thiamine kinase-like enzyme
MPEHPVCDRHSSDLRAHPAFQAWQSLSMEVTLPTGLVVLKAQRNEGEKSGVYRLEGCGPGGSAVIAKRCQRPIAAVERVIYEDVLPNLSEPGLKYYGFIEEPEGNFTWLFLEDAGGEEYSPGVEKHRHMAARWLAHLHVATERSAALSRIPARGPKSYLEHLRTACDRILGNLRNPALAEQDRQSLMSLVGVCRLLTPRWSRMREFCERMPHAVVHGDFVEKNLRIRNGSAGPILIPFDWEMAGCATPAADLAECPDLDAYYSEVRSSWPHLTLADIRRMAEIGRIFRWAAALDWASWGLAFSWIGKSMEHLKCYLGEITDHLAGSGGRD